MRKWTNTDPPDLKSRMYFLYHGPELRATCCECGLPADGTRVDDCDSHYCETCFAILPEECKV